MLLTLLGCTVLSACGGGGDTPASAGTPAAAPAPIASVPSAAEAAVSLPPASAADVLAATVTPAATGGDEKTSTNAARRVPPKTMTVAPPPTGGALTSVDVENTGTAQVRVPVTFGQVFAPGDLPANYTVTGRLADGTSVPLQVDVKARHSDGSLRHGVISAFLPSLSQGQTQNLGMVKTAAEPAPAATSPAELLAAGFTAQTKLLINGVAYSASADSMLRSGAYTTWLSGNVVNEWHVAAPFKTADGITHPHLVARYAIRAVKGSARARVDLTIENGWTYELNPQNVTYDVQTLVGGSTTYTKAALNHFHHARWRRLDWFGATPQVHIKHNAAYLIASKAVANYDRSLVIPEAVLTNLKNKWTGTKIEPMGAGIGAAYMPMTGGRSDIGLMPSWSVIYLLSMDKRAKEVMLGMADLAGSWSAHYRNKTTDRPVSIVEYPYISIFGKASDTYNRTTLKYEALPACTNCAQLNTTDTAHQPAFAYLPYIVTGDAYYLEELQFYGMWNVLSANPHYREYAKGLVTSDQIRGQAWSMRTLGEAAYITPDADPLKAHFQSFVSNNLDYYNTNYSNNPNANKLGILLNGFVYYNGVAIAPWQDDFFTSSMGHLTDLGFTKAQTMLMYKSKFPLSRMIGPGACWIDGAAYNLKVRDSTTTPLYTSIGQVFEKTETAAFTALNCDPVKVAAFFKLQVGEMTGYSSSTEGYPSNMQPALAYSAQINGVTGAQAWNVFMARSVKPDYTWGPQFAIIPR